MWTAKKLVRFVHDRTFLEKRLIFVASLIVLFLIALVFTVIIIDRKFEKLHLEERGNATKVCNSTACVLFANNMLSSLNKSADPCSNFYQYACGNWKNNNPIPNDRSVYSVTHKLRDSVDEQLKELLEQDVLSASKSVNKARIAYRSCMDTKTINWDKIKDLRSLLDNLGGWPIMEEDCWSEDAIGITDLLLSVSGLASSGSLFSFFVDRDRKNSSKQLIYITQPSLGLGKVTREYYLDGKGQNKQMGAYRKYLMKIVRVLFYDRKSAFEDDELDRSIKEIVDFEIRIAKITVSEADRRNENGNSKKMTVRKLLSIVPTINWVRYFNNIGPQDGMVLSNSTEVVVYDVGYFYKFSKLIQYTEDRILYNYIIWRAVLDNVAFLDERFKKLQAMLDTVISGRKRDPPRWKECVDFTRNIFPFAIGNIYVEKHFSEENRTIAMNLVSGIRKSFRKLLEDNRWMDESTKMRAIDKMQSMINSVGYNPIVRNITALDGIYSELDILSDDTYFDVARKANQFAKRNEFMKLSSNSNKISIDDVSPALVNAFYSAERNMITLPSAILQPPFFHFSFPNSVNFGSIGSIIAHEIMHGFDDRGRGFDKSGNLLDWWSNDSSIAFDEKRGCIVKQYSGYKVNEIDRNLNGRLTQGENIADNGGINVAYEVFTSFSNSHDTKSSISGLEEFTDGQLFFLSFASVRCAQQNTESLQKQVSSNHHAPPEFRVNGPLRNMEQFSAAFGCKRGTGMNPIEKCVVF